MKKENFKELEKTKEYMETFYFKATIKEDCGDYITLNAFWCDYAKFFLEEKQNNKFLSQNFLQCYESETQRFLCQVVLGMPWETKASVHQTTADESRGCHIKAGSPCIIFKKEIKEVDIDLKQDFMVTHRYYRIDSYGKQNRSEDDDAVPSEFLVNVPYECEVIMTNVSPENIEFNLLYQVPIGSMPIRTTKFMKCLPLSLSSYSTER